MQRFDQIQEVPRVDWQDKAFMDQMFNWSERYPNFAPQELACKCCGLLVVNPRALTSLQKLRDTWKAPLSITSATRCKKHNERVGGATQSLHLSGRAFDISTPQSWTGVHISSFLYWSTIAEFRGIGLYPSWIHVDNGFHRTWEQGDSRLDPWDNQDTRELE